MQNKFSLVLKSGKTIAATAYGGNKEAPWSPSGNHYQIIVEYFALPGDKKTCRFDFWDSVHNMRTGEPCDVRGALACWAMDVSAGMNADSVDDIASEFCYDKPSEAMRVFKGVKKSQAQYERIGMDESDLQELSDY